MAVMRAAVFTGAGGVDSVELREVPRPAPSGHQVLVRVRATALNRADVLQREGRYPPPPGAPGVIAGLEFAGEVEAVGDRATRFAPGARVFGLIEGGAHAEWLLAHERLLMEIPESLSFSDAAAIPEVFITAHDALVTQANATAGERVLIHAVASGVGTAAVQVARALGLVPYGTTRTPEKLEEVRALGLEDGVALSGDLSPLADRVQRWTGGDGVDVVLDLVGGPYVEASINVLALRGRLILIGTIAGREARIPLGRVLSRRLTIRGTVMRSRDLEEKALTTERFVRDLMPALARGELRPVIDSRFPFVEIRAAYRRMDSNESVGKIVLEV